MKKKELITIIIIAIVLAAILFGAIFLTSRRKNTSEERLINVYNPIMNGKILYNSSGIPIIDPEIPDISELPVDLSAFGIDNFDKNLLIAGNFDGINLYFSYRHNNGLTDEYQFYRYNSITAEISKIEFKTGFDRNSFYNFYAHGGYLYYSSYDDFTNYEELKNSCKYLCRVPVGGGKEEVLAKYDDTGEFICFVDGDSVVTANRSSISVWDVSKKKKTEIFNAERNGFRLITAERSFYYQGIMYFEAEKDLPSVADADEGFKESWRTPDSYLIALDIKKKEWKKAVDDPVSIFCVTEDEIFYVKKKYRWLPKSDFALSINDILTVYGDSSICSQPIGGGEERVVYTNEKISYNEIFSVKNGKLCGRINSPTETDYDYKVKFAVIDFSSKNIVHFDISEPTISDEE